MNVFRSVGPFHKNSSGVSHYNITFVIIVITVHFIIQIKGALF